MAVNPEGHGQVDKMEARVERPNRSSAIVHIRIPQRLLAPSEDNDDQLQLNIQDIDGREEWMFPLEASASVSFAVPIPLRPGNRFALSGRLLRRWLAPPPNGGDQKEVPSTPSGPVTPVVRVGYKTIDSALVVFRAELTVKEVQQLLLKSISFMSLQHRPSNQLYVPCHFFYRSKPHKYFNNIFCYQAGIMAVYRKNKNGDPASPINGQLDGLFFSVNVDLTTGLPVVPSLYGPARLNILSRCMFQMAPNVYFCDFYCHYKSHHVTLVMTKPRSAADVFCRSRLKLLDNFKNPFLYIDSKSQTVYVTTRVWVQVFFTENINLGCVLQNQVGFIDDVPSQPVPATTVEGVPKNPLCSICNVN